MKRKINRSAKTGKLVTKEFTVANPETTVSETITDTGVSYFKAPNRVATLTQSFSNGELNVLRDKINEIISRDA